MNKPKAFCFSPDNHGFSNDKWDFGLLHDTFKTNKIKVLQVRELKKTSRAFVVAPGFEWHGQESRLSEELNKINRVVLFITSDEGGVFDVEKINHPNIEIWIQYPYPRHEKYNRMALGAPSHVHELIPNTIEKTTDIFFVGQRRHPRREQLIDALSKLDNAVYKPTGGFSQGYAPKEYYEKMSMSRIVPAPSGTLSIDSFRFYEAIECLSIPIADRIDNHNRDYNFWESIFTDIPFPQVSNWTEELPDLTNALLQEYPNNMHQIVAWWIRYKRDFAIKIMEQIYEH